MQLAQLRLTNIRSYESADLPLGPGTTLLVGDVGAGKTSLLFAIEMALFGFAEVDPTFLVRHHAVDSTVALTIESEGHRYEFRRRFRRKTRRGKDVFELDTSTYSEDGATTEYSTTELRQRAIQLLGFPDNPNPRSHSDLWRWAVYVPQERMREVLAQEPSERLETVRKALGLEQYRQAADNAQLLAAELRRMAERAESEASGRDHWVGRLPELRADRDAQLAELSRHDAELGRRRADLRAAEAVLHEAEEREAARARDRVEEDQLRERRRSDEAHLQRAEERRLAVDTESQRLAGPSFDPAPIAARMADAESRRSTLDQRVHQVRTRQEAGRRWITERATLETQRRALRAALDDALEEVERASTEVRVTRQELTRLREDGPQREPPAPTPRTLGEIDAEARDAELAVRTAAGIEGQLQHVATDLAELRAEGVCPRCHQAVDPGEFGVHVERANQELAEQRERTLLASARVARLQEERRSRERYERSLQRWRDLERGRAAAATTVERAEQRLAAAQARHQRTTDEGAVLEARWREVDPQARAAAELDRELADAEADRARSDEALRQLAAELDRARQAMAARSQLAAEQDRLSAELAELQANLSDVVRRLDAVRERLGRSAESPQAVAAARRRVEGARDGERETLRDRERAGSRVESLARQIEEAEGQLAERARSLHIAEERRSIAQWIGGTFRESILTLEHRLLARAQDEFARHFAQYFSVLVEDPALTARCDAGFSPAVEIDGEWTPAEALSGGERTALALAFRLALGGVVRGAGRLRLDTLILDEPTDGFSPEQVLKMGELLEGLGVPQVVLVSHENALSSIADRVIRVTKTNGRSILLANGRGEAPAAAAPAPGPRPPRRRAHSPRLDSSAEASPLPPST